MIWWHSTNTSAIVDDTWLPWDFAAKQSKQKTRDNWIRCIVDREQVTYECYSHASDLFRVHLHPIAIGEAVVVCLATQIPVAAAQLSSRELQILKLMANGHTTAKIAMKLSIKKSTVETHRANMRKKTGLSLVGLIALAVQIRD